MTTYKVVEGVEPLTFEKTGHIDTFKAQSVVDAIKKLEKHLKENTAQAELEAAKMHNYKEHNAFLSELTEEQIHAAYLFHIAFSNKKECDRVLGETTAALKEFDEFADELEKQTGKKVKEVEQTQ